MVVLRCCSAREDGTVVVLRRRATEVGCGCHGWNKLHAREWRKMVVAVAAPWCAERQWWLEEVLQWRSGSREDL